MKIPALKTFIYSYSNIDKMQLSTLCYLKKDNKTLMLHRNKKENDLHEGKWNGLGGKFEVGESPEECCIREVYEESGLNAKNPKLKGFCSFPNFDGEGTDWYGFVFVIEDFSGEMINSNEGELHWIDDDKLLDLNLWEGDRYFLPLLEKQGMFSGKFIYKNKQLIDYEMNIYD